jgi:bifunctional non-homologous end joining protein LigD
MSTPVSTRLDPYRRKRDFTRSREPAGADALAGNSGALYVMHKHAASHDHFDLRIEQDGVLRSWALPKGPALEAGEKRLAVEVEDHPLEYGGFEGTIPQQEYGGGTVMIWDIGRWRINGRNDADQLDFVLEGRKLKGAWSLVRTSRRGSGRKRQHHWLLIKRSDRSGKRLQPDDLSVTSGRTMQEIAAAGGSATPSPALVPDPERLAGARKAGLPDAFAPQLATLADAAPDGEGWLHEIKFDGYRLLARIEQGRTRLFTRNGHDWTARFREQAQRLDSLPVRQALLDGELVAMSNDGASDFGRLQEAISGKETDKLVFQVFDLIHLDGHDLTGARLIDRKQLLQQLMQAAGYSANDRIRYSDHIRGQGPGFMEQACALGLEGVVSKRMDAPYRSGRGRGWLKIKCTLHDEFVVAGYTPPSGARSGFGALLLAIHDDDRLVYAGRVGTGFSQRQLTELHALLRKLEISRSPLAEMPADSGDARWVRPEVVVEVEYAERTREGRLRAPTFRGVREDRDATEIVANASARQQMPSTPSTGRQRRDVHKVAGVTLTNPERVMFPDQGLTKLDLARYYEAIADWILPWLANRPLSLVRCPAGRHQECFYQKHPGASLAKSVPRIPIPASSGSRDYVYVRRLADIVALVQSGVLEFHPWGSQVGDIEHPDLMVFDLDPGEGVSWSAVVHTARDLRSRLADLGLPAFARTTGGKGLHLVVPLQPRAGWDEVKAFSRAVSERHARASPDRLTTTSSKARRRGRIFIDYLRNGRGATAIASYSARARPGAPVAVPLRWDEVGPGVPSDRYSVGNLRRRLNALKADPWGDFYHQRAVISDEMRREVGLIQ